MAVLLPERQLTPFQYDISHMMFVPDGIEVPLHEMESFILDETYSAANIRRYEDLDAHLIGDAFRFLPISKARLIRMAGKYGIKELARETINQVNRETKEQINDAVSLVDHLPFDEQLLPTAYILSGNAHEGKKRKTGRPYHEHVERVAAMGYFVARTLEDEGLRNDPERTASEIVVRLFHDAPEETMPAGKHFDPNREGHYSPLLVLRLMDRFHNRYARATADGVRSVTHLSGMPWMRGYPNYIYNRVMQSFEGTEAKEDDIFDNRHNEPKPVTTRNEWGRRELKHNDYDMIYPLLQARSLELAPTHECLSWIKRGIEIRKEIVPGLQEDKVQLLRDFIGVDRLDIAA